MSEFIKNRSTERGQIEIAKAILSLVSDKDYVKTLHGQEFKDNPASEYGQKAIANAIRAIGGQTVTTVTKTNPFISNNASLGGQQEIIDAIISVKGDIGGGTPTLEDKTVKSTNVEQTVTAGEGYDGIGTVTVTALDLETKTVKSTGTEQTITPTSGKDGISSITVSALDMETKTVKSTTTSQTVTPTSGKDGISQITVSPIVLETVNVTLTNSAQEITKSDGYDAIGTVNVPAAPSGNDRLPEVCFSSDNIYSLTIYAPNANDLTFKGLNSIKSINLPDATEIGASAFRSQNVNDVSGQNVEIVGQYAFNGCTSLHTIDMPKLKTIKSNAFSTSMSFGGVSYYPNGIEFPNVETIEQSAFYFTSVKDVILPKIQTIASQAFGSCTQMRTLTITRTDDVCTLQNTDALPSGLTNIYVPAALVDSYKAASNWSTYASKISAIPS